MNINKYPTCEYCKLRPSALGFVTDERTINLCKECIMELGGMEDKDKNKFFEKLGITPKDK